MVSCILYADPRRPRLSDVLCTRTPPVWRRLCSCAGSERTVRLVLRGIAQLRARRRRSALLAQNYATQAQTSYNNTVSAGTTAVNNITSAKTSALNSITAAESSAVNLIDNHTTSGVSQVNSAKNDGVSTLNSLVNTATTTANNAVSQIEASEAAVQETMDTAIAELLSYADDPNKVIYEYTENNGNFRITALASQVTVQEPNSVTYEYDDSTDTITFTAD